MQATPERRRRLPRWTYQLAQAALPEDNPHTTANKKLQTPVIITKQSEAQTTDHTGEVPGS